MLESINTLFESNLSLTHPHIPNKASTHNYLRNRVYSFVFTCEPALHLRGKLLFMGYREDDEEPMRDSGDEPFDRLYRGCYGYSSILVIG